jgi:hypothetical protein
MFQYWETQRACAAGDLAAVQEHIVGKSVFGVHVMFITAWQGGHMHVVRWLASVFMDNMATIIECACHKGVLDLAQWLHEANVGVRRFRPSLWVFAYASHLEVIKWLYSFGTATDVWRQTAFVCSCRFGHLEIAKWLLSLGTIDIHEDGDAAFGDAVLNDRQTKGAGLRVARWLLSLDPEYIAWPAVVLPALQHWNPTRDAWMRSIVRPCSTRWLTTQPSPLHT